MKTTWKFFKHELKKQLWTLVVLSAVCAVPYVVALAAMDLVVRVRLGEGGYDYYVQSPNLGIVFAELGILCFLAPVLAYSFKMNKRSVDAYYALPIKKEKLYLVKTLVGLALVLVPFTVSFFGGFFTIAFRPDCPYKMGLYIPTYFGGVLLGICLFGLNAFLFTRANRLVDGVAFMAAYAFIGLLVLAYYEAATGHYLKWRIEECVLTFGPIMIFCDATSHAVRGLDISRMLNAFVFVYPVALGAIGYFLLFFNLRYEKAENAEQVSESWFGYRVLIPAYIALTIGLCDFDLLSLCVIAVCGVVAMVVYRRKFRFSWKWWVMLAGAFALGLALCGLVELLDAARYASIAFESAALY